MKYFLSGIAGAIAGWVYWYFVGCLSGTCPLQSYPWYDMIYGALLCLFIVDLFKKKKNGTKKSIGIE